MGHHGARQAECRWPARLDRAHDGPAREGQQVFIPVTDWFPSFLLTLVIEAPIVVALLRDAEPNLARLAVLFVTINLATHLVVWYVFTQALLPGTVEYALAAEGWAIGAESVFYRAAVRGVSVRRAVAAAVLANAASFLVGRAVVALWPELLGWRAV
jgi:hypothetical protein